MKLDRLVDKLYETLPDGGIEEKIKRREFLKRAGGLVGGIYLYSLLKYSLGQKIPKEPPLILYIAWGPLNRENVNFLKRAGVDTFYKLIGDLQWSKVEKEEGKFNFSTLREDLKLLREENLKALPTLDFLSPPNWFVEKFPESVLRYSDGTTDDPPTISLAWLVDAIKEEKESWHLFRNYMYESLQELNQFPNVIGVMLPWTLFNGRLCKGTWEEIIKYPQKVLLAGWDEHYRKRWRLKKEPPRTWTDFKELSRDEKYYWKRWIENTHGEAAFKLLDFIHNHSPDYFIALNKHIWIKDIPEQQFMYPDLAAAAGLDDVHFKLFFDWIKKFVYKTNWHGIIFNDDAFFDSSKIENFKETKKMVAEQGLLFMGEASNEPPDGGSEGLLQSISAVHPDCIAFIPFPGGHGEHLIKTGPQKAIQFMHKIK